MPELSTEQQMRIRKLLDEGDRIEARQHRAEMDRLKYRPWLWGGVAGRWLADWAARNRLVGMGGNSRPRNRLEPASVLTDEQKIERLRRALRSKSPPDT